MCRDWNQSGEKDIGSALTGLELLKIIQREKISSSGTGEEGKHLSVDAEQELTLGVASLNVFQSGRNME